MRAIRFEEVGIVRIVSVPEPAAGRGEVLVKVAAAGICGSDRHILAGTYPSRPPVILGHEFEGTVVECGPDTRLRTGTRVTVDPNISCGRCEPCRRGAVAYCKSLCAIGVDRDGGFAEYVAVPEGQAHGLPGDVGAGLGALCEPLGCCLHALDHATIRPGESVAVFGGGVMGQLLVQLTHLAGAAQVVLVTRQPKRRSLALSLGATDVVDPRSGDVIEAIAGNRGIAPGGVDVAFEAAGVAETFVEAIAVAARGGRVVVVGAAPQGANALIAPYEVFFRELRIEGSFLNPLTHGRAAALLGSNLIALEQLVTARISLDEVPARLATNPGRGEVKTLVVAP